MALRKIYLAVDCGSDEQRDAVQRIFDDVSNMRLLKGNQIQSVYPYIKSHQNDLYQLFNMVAKDGVKSLMSANGISVVTRLARR